MLRSKECREKRVLTLKLKAGKCERRENGDDKREYSRHYTYVESIEEQTSEKEVSVLEYLYVVLKVEILGDKRGDGALILVKVLKGRDDHPIEGENDDERHDTEEEVEENLHDDLNDLLLARNLLHVLFLKSSNL